MPLRPERGYQEQDERALTGGSVLVRCPLKSIHLGVMNGFTSGSLTAACFTVRRQIVEGLRQGGPVDRVEAGRCARLLHAAPSSKG